MYSNVEFLKQVIESLEEGVIVQNAEGENIFFNSKALSILELTESEFLGTTSRDPQWEPLKLSGEPYTYNELPTTTTRTTGKAQKNVLVGLKTANQKRKWIRVNTSKFDLDVNSFVFASFTDVTEQHETEINKERLDLALLGSELGVWDIDLKNEELHLSKESYRLLGYQEGDLDKNISAFTSIIFEDDRSTTVEDFTDYTTGKTSVYETEYRIVSGDGAVKWIHTTGRIIGVDEFGKPQRVAGTFRDISTRKKIETELKLSDTKFYNAFQYSSIGMALVSPEGRWIDVNPAVLDLLGYEKTELLKLSFQDITHRDDLDKDLQFVEKMLKGELSTYSMEKRYFHKKGFVVWALLSVSLVRDTDGQPKFFISQILDITNTKNLIDELKNKNQLLNLTTESLENKINQLEEFSRIVAHNLRGPAGNISMLADLLENEPENSDLYLGMLKESADSLESTLKELIHILEIKLNKKIPFDKCNVQEIIAKIKAMFNVQIVSERIEIEEDIELKEILYPKSYLESILYNLISNAIKYRNKDEKPVIKIRTYHHEEKNFIEVADNGIGIDLKKYGHQVFKLNKTFHRGYDSKGVGLFITKNQIETLGGSIGIQSKPGEGTTFKIQL